MIIVKIKIPHHPPQYFFHAMSIVVTFPLLNPGKAKKPLAYTKKFPVSFGKYPSHPNFLGLYFIQQIHFGGLTSRIIGLP